MEFGNKSGTWLGLRRQVAQCCRDLAIVGRRCLIGTCKNKVDISYQKTSRFFFIINHPTEGFYLAPGQSKLNVVMEWMAHLAQLPVKVLTQQFLEHFQFHSCQNLPELDTSLLPTTFLSQNYKLAWPTGPANFQ